MGSSPAWYPAYDQSQGMLPLLSYCSPEQPQREEVGRAPSEHALQVLLMLLPVQQRLPSLLQE